MRATPENETTWYARIFNDGSEASWSDRIDDTQHLRPGLANTRFPSFATRSASRFALRSTRILMAFVDNADTKASQESESPLWPGPAVQYPRCGLPISREREHLPIKSDVGQ